ncbi:membrane-associated protein, putative [Bodo saltans]|uniref:Membrane-associated protein, putative n=1 Tax=Bodo saltans TaxID=75058 RepID=A0A0S4J104_BODSA|nr:membrane-associated protein, putative [Bodo saltans]|eukprot:CUG26363.1 membrane-associated protein, putative [Bodo saltans]
MFRGAAVGSTALLAAACFAVIPVAALYRHFSERRSQVGGSRESSISSALARLRLPGRVFVVYSVLLQPTATACAGLLMLALSGGDIVLAVIVALLWFGVLLWFVWAVQCGCSRLVTARIIELSVGGGVLDFVVERRNDRVPQSHLHADDVSLCTEPKWLLHPSHEGAEHFAHQFSVLISSVGGGPWREQYYCFGCLWSVATGVVGALEWERTKPSRCWCHCPRFLLATIYPQ